MHRVAEDEGHLVRDRRRLAPDLGDALAGVRVVHGDDLVWNGGVEGDDGGFEVVDVLFRPSQLQPDTVESFSHACSG
jgi:hypothetical protein